MVLIWIWSGIVWSGGVVVFLLLFLLWFSFVFFFFFFFSFLCCASVIFYNSGYDFLLMIEPFLSALLCSLGRLPVCIVYLYRNPVLIVYMLLGYCYCCTGMDRTDTLSDLI